MTAGLSSIQRSSIQQNSYNPCLKNRQNRPAFQGVTTFYPSEKAFEQTFENLFVRLINNKSNDTKLPKVIEATRDRILEFLTVVKSETERLPANITSALNIREMKTKRGGHCFGYAIDHMMADSEKIGQKSFINQTLYVDRFTGKIFKKIKKSFFDPVMQFKDEIKDKEDMKDFLKTSLSEVINNYLKLKNTVGNGVSTLRTITGTPPSQAYSRLDTLKDISRNAFAENRQSLLK